MSTAIPGYVIAQVSELLDALVDVEIAAAAVQTAKEQFAAANERSLMLRERLNIDLVAAAKAATQRMVAES